MLLRLQLRRWHLTELCDELAVATVGWRTGGSGCCEMVKFVTLVWWQEEGGVYTSSVSRDETAYGGKVANRDPRA